MKSLTPLQKGLAVALAQMLIMGAVAVKLAVDRASLPKMWVETAPFDPDLPIRGRYVRLAVVVEPEGRVVDGGSGFAYFSGSLKLRGDKLVAVPDDGGAHYFRETRCGPEGDLCVVLDRPLAFFIPEHIDDPSVRPPGEELWVEVSVPPGGAPRPVRLGVKKVGQSDVQPLDF